MQAKPGQGVDGRIYSTENSEEPKEASQHAGGKQLIFVSTNMLVLVFGLRDRVLEKMNQRMNTPTLPFFNVGVFILAAQAGRVEKKAFGQQHHRAALK
jgi:hypothetical protein